MQTAIQEHTWLYSDVYKQFFGLVREKMEIECFVRSFRNSDADYIKIKQIVKERVDILIMNNIELRKAILSKSGYVLEGTSRTEDFFIDNIINGKNYNFDNTNSINDSSEYIKSTLERAKNIYSNMLIGITNQVMESVVQSAENEIGQQQSSQSFRSNEVNYADLITLPDIPKLPSNDYHDENIGDSDDYSSDNDNR
jgi:hypothetical protein